MNNLIHRDRICGMGKQFKFHPSKHTTSSKKITAKGPVSRYLHTTMIRKWLGWAFPYLTCARTINNYIGLLAIIECHAIEHRSKIWSELWQNSETQLKLCYLSSILYGVHNKEQPSLACEMDHICHEKGLKFMKSTRHVQRLVLASKWSGAGSNGQPLHKFDRQWVQISTVIRIPSRNHEKIIVHSFRAVKYVPRSF